MRCVSHRPFCRVLTVLLAVPLLFLSSLVMAQTAQAIAWAPPAAAAEPSQVDVSLGRVAQALLDQDGTSAAALMPAQRSQLLIVAGRNAKAVASIQSLMDALRAEGNDDRARRWLPYLLLAESRLDETACAACAYADAFRARFAALDDLEALKIHYWFVADVEQATVQLEQALARHAGVQKRGRVGLSV